MIIKIIFIISLVLENVFEFFLAFLNDKYVKVPLPENVKDVYDEEKYNKWLNYRNACKKVSTASTIVSAIFTLVLLVFNIHAKIFNLLNFNKFIQYILFILIFSVVTLPFSIPFEYYQNFKVEEEYGFNKSTRKTFWIDQIKSFILDFVLSTLLFLFVMVVFEFLGNWGILIVIVAIIAFNLVVACFSLQVLKIFNKFTPLEEGDLRTGLLQLCEKYNVQVKDIYVMDASKRTTRANAFCTGLTKKKTISLDDNLVNKYSTEEIVAVFAHEFGHAKYKHNAKSVWFAFFRIIILILSLGVILNIPAICQAFGFEDVNYFFSFTILTMISWPISKAFDLISNKISRTFEYQADAFAAKEGYGDALISALKRLSKDSLVNLNPHPFVVMLEHSHPTLSQRIDAIDKLDKK